MSLRPIARLALAVSLLTGTARADLTRRMSLRVKDQSLATVLRTICKFADLNLMVGPELNGRKVTAFLKDMTVGSILSYLSKLHRFGCAVTPDGKTVLAGSKQAIDSLDVEDIRVVPLNHANSENMAQLLNKVYQGKVTVVSDPHTNSVILVPNAAN